MRTLPAILALLLTGCVVYRKVEVNIDASDRFRIHDNAATLSARLETPGMAQRERESVDTRDDGEYPSFTAGVSNKASRADCFQPVPR